MKILKGTLEEDLSRAHPESAQIIFLTSGEAEYTYKSKLSLPEDEYRFSYEAK
jgi:hypothetical protein